MGWFTDLLKDGTEKTVEVAAAGIKEAINQVGVVAETLIKKLFEAIGIPPSVIDNMKEGIGNFINGAVKLFTGVDMKADAEAKALQSTREIANEAKELGVDINVEHLRAGMKELEADGAPKALTDIDSISSAFKAASDDEKIEMAEMNNEMQISVRFVFEFTECLPNEF